jgi:hypothetical protein
VRQAGGREVKAELTARDSAGSTFLVSWSA